MVADGAVVGVHLRLIGVVELEQLLFIFGLVIVIELSGPDHHRSLGLVLGQSYRALHLLSEGLVGGVGLVLEVGDDEVLLGEFLEPSTGPLDLVAPVDDVLSVLLVEGLVGLDDLDDLGDVLLVVGGVAQHIELGLDQLADLLVQLAHELLLQLVAGQELLVGLDILQELLGEGLFVLEDLLPEVGVVDVDGVVGVVAHELGLAEAEGPLDQVDVGVPGVLDYLVDVVLHERLGLLVPHLFLVDPQDPSFQQELDLLLVELLADVVALAVPLELAPQENGLIQPQLLGGSLEHLRLIGLRGDQTVHLHFLLLADSMGTRSGLHVVLRVPVRIEDDHDVGAGQVDPQPSCFRR